MNTSLQVEGEGCCYAGLIISQRTIAENAELGRSGGPLVARRFA